MAVRFGPEDVGRRITVRARSLDDADRTVDIVGVLRAWTSEGATIERRDGSVVAVAADRMLAGRVVAPELSARDLQQRCAADWTCQQEQPLGPWTLRLHPGLERDRTTSALALRLPDAPPDVMELLEQVRAFYAAHERPAQVLVLAGSVVDAAVAAQGWTVTNEIDVLVARLDQDDAAGPSSAAPSSAAPAPVGIGFSAEPPERLLRVQSEGGDPEPLRRLLATGPPARYGTARLPTGASVGSVRITRADRWAGITFMEVDPAHRRQGIGAALLAAALESARQDGAGHAWLQVEAANAPAQALYAAAGFLPHHRYRYRRPA
ncbi:MAG TPA: GNAT family N-acetyltransferase [Candidatus Eisenbacteria bacterium]|nr:GNAT family N-acetyltransferase [Candidatus Eisenbacteria bacterium]